jgi:hypothetical protein
VTLADFRAQLANLPSEFAELRSYLRDQYWLVDECDSDAHAYGFAKGGRDIAAALTDMLAERSDDGTDRIGGLLLLLSMGDATYLTKQAPVPTYGSLTLYSDGWYTSYYDQVFSDWQ